MTKQYDKIAFPLGCALFIAGITIRLTQGETPWAFSCLVAGALAFLVAYVLKNTNEHTLARNLKFKKKVEVAEFVLRNVMEEIATHAESEAIRHKAKKLLNSRNGIFDSIETEVLGEEFQESVMNARG